MASNIPNQQKYFKQIYLAYRWEPTDTTSGQSGSGSNGIEGVFYPPLISVIGISTSEAV